MPPPELTPVESTSIEAVGYDPDAEELFVRFVGGATYAYGDASEGTYHALLDAESKGGFVNREVKPHHRYRRL